MGTTNIAAGCGAHGARETIRLLREALDRAERHHQECWDETERVSDIRARLCDLKREARAREIADAELGGTGCPGECGAGCPSPSQGDCRLDGSVTCKELLGRIEVLRAAARQADLQQAFYSFYSAELAVDKARADLFDALHSLPEHVLAEIGEREPAQEELDTLPNAWGLAAVEQHARGASGAAGEPDPVDQLNYRRWLVELSQGAVDYSAHLEREMSRHKTELDVLRQQAANVEFFDRDELAQIEQAVVLQKARITACQEQLDELANAAGALDKRMASCKAELRRFLERPE